MDYGSSLRQGGFFLPGNQTWCRLENPEKKRNGCFVCKEHRTKWILEAKQIYIYIQYVYIYNNVYIYIYNNVYIYIWLVVWNMAFIFPYLGKNNPN